MKNGSETDSITWLKEDPFPYLVKRDLLMVTAHAVVGGMPVIESDLFPVKLTQPERDWILTCLDLTDRRGSHGASALPNQYYACFWAAVSQALRLHHLDGRLGHSSPEPYSFEYYDELNLSRYPFLLDEHLQEEVTDLITRNQFGSILDIIANHCEKKISTLLNPFPTLYDAIEEVRRARDDASCVLQRIQGFVNEESEP